MESNFFSALEEMSVRFSRCWIGTEMEPNREIDKTALANAVLESSATQATLILKHIGTFRRLEAEDFGAIVGIIATEQAALIEYLTNQKISVLQDCSCDVEAVCHQAMLAARR